MDTMIWILVVYLWSDNPSRVTMIHSREYPSHQTCIEERKTWVEKNIIATCTLKNNLNGNR